MNDCELLELAAKAAGHRYDAVVGSALISGSGFVWNPLVDDGDALRLAVKLNMMLSYILIDGVHVQWDSGVVVETVFNNPYAATRRAIVRAAAEIGRRME